jgi:hypothetical protein
MLVVGKVKSKTRGSDEFSLALSALSNTSRKASANGATSCSNEARQTCTQSSRRFPWWLDTFNPGSVTEAKAGPATSKQQE